MYNYYKSYKIDNSNYYYVLCDVKSSQMAEELRSEFSFFPSTSEESCSTQQVVHYRKKKDEVADNGDNDDSSDAVSSVDENLEIVSVASSVDDRLRYRRTV